LSLFDTLQFPLALKLKSGCEFCLSGILFRPTIRYNKFSGTESLTFKEKISRWRKAQLLRIYLHHNCLKVLLYLDLFAIDEIQKQTQKFKILHLPEPMLDIKSSPSPSKP